MARQKNDGRGRMGGRAKGTPNKNTATLREWVTGLIDNNRAQVEKDLKQLEPQERVKFLERLMGYVLPKPTTMAVDLNATTQLLPAGDPLAKPPGLMLIGFKPWEDMTDQEKARHIAKHYEDMANGTGKGGGISIGFDFGNNE